MTLTVDRILELAKEAVNQTYKFDLDARTIHMTSVALERFTALIQEEVAQEQTFHPNKFEVLAGSNPWPDKLEHETARLVVRFASALAFKLAAAEEKYGYSDGWMSDDWLDECRQKLREHLDKGDPRDVANYCAFLWHHAASTALAAPQQPSGVAEGWQLVPKEPLFAMIEAGMRAMGEWCEPSIAERESGVPLDADLSPEDANAINHEMAMMEVQRYKAALAAAPTPPVTGKG